MLIPNNKNAQKISYSLLRLVWKLVDTDKKIRNYGTDQQLYVAEIHMIKTIKENEGIHITGLAEKLNITKGAVSQIVMKLEKKGMIIKDRDENNQSKLSLKVSPKGEIAYTNHENYHRQFDQKIGEILMDASQENIEFLKQFMSSVEREIDKVE